MPNHQDAHRDATPPQEDVIQDQAPGAVSAGKRPRRAVIVGLAVILVLVMLVGAPLGVLTLVGVGPPRVPQHCLVQTPQQGQCARVFASPGSTGQVIDCLPPGTEVQVFEDVFAEEVRWYRIASYSYHSGPLQITTLLPGGAADDAGLQAGDVVLQIDDMDMAVTPLNVGSRYLRERVGHSLTFVVGRNGQELVVEVVPRAPSPQGGGSLGIGVTGGLFRGDEGYMGGPALVCN